MVQNRVAEITRRSADGHRAPDRADDAGHLPGVHHEPHGLAADAGSLRLRELRRQAGDRASARRGHHRGAGERHPRDRGDPRSCAPHGRTTDGRRRLRRAAQTEHDTSRRAVRGIGPAAPDARIGALEERGRYRERAGEGHQRRHASRVGPRHRHARLAGSHPAHHRQRTRRGVDEHLSADRRQHSRPQGGHGRGARQPREDAAGRHQDEPRLRPGAVRRRVDRERPRRHPDRRLPRHRRPPRLPPRLATDDDRRGHAADGRHPDLRLHVAVRRDDQPDVDGRPGRGDRPGHRRRGGRRREHPPPRRRRREQHRRRGVRS